MKLTPAFPNLVFEAPVLMLQAPGDASRWYVVEQGVESGAAVKVFANDPNASSTSDFVRFAPGEVTLGKTQEGGLLGFAFHPDYANNGTVFMSYNGHSATSPVGMNSVVTRMKKAASGDILDRATEEVLVSNDGRKIEFDQPADEHKNCHLAFGKDGKLYIGFGDGGEDQGGNNAQDKSGFFAKIIRIDVGPTGPYTIPPDNPWVEQPLGVGELKETWAYGFRNPWRWSFDRQTGDLWLGDVGQDSWEEVDRVTKGGNYGWPITEGSHCVGSATCDKTGLQDPVVEYPHENADLAIIGGFVYRGTKIPSLVGSYVFADVVSGRISRIVYDPVTKAPSIEDIAVAGFTLSAMGEGVDGELYVVDYIGGTLHRIDPLPAGVNPVAEKLSATGCVNKDNPKEASDGMIPYAVNMPLWSDGADKRRWMAVPDGANVQVMPEGDWNFPIGSVLMKQFSLGGKLVETRFFVRHDDGDWAGYSYEWNDDQSDATLLHSLKTKAVGNQTWTFPGRSHCLQCHTDAAGNTLGLENGQLNGNLTYPNTNRISNQLSTLDHIGLLTSPIGDPAVAARYSTLESSDPIDMRARAYLHANCSGCHRPGGGVGGSSMDLRFSTPFASAGVCNGEPALGAFGIAGAKIVAPGAPAKSIISYRMHGTGALHMPPVATHLVHEQGAGLVDAWIQSLTACP
ncbi:hypothetical protein AKJ09_10594 [Labilithrix luteola]|uniref:Glucose/Sorbosone dehydrogenase domain-containing protein n=1 Tax=Labilithrix luteola TaxID=1391654 RepID=A0A0K1QDT1_9BACT|nr:hypothetical protein AKJ09_10594 [Labilithrix luteola]